MHLHWASGPASEGQRDPVPSEDGSLQTTSTSRTDQVGPVMDVSPLDTTPALRCPHHPFLMNMVSAFSGCPLSPNPLVLPFPLLSSWGFPLTLSLPFIACPALMAPGGKPRLSRLSRRHTLLGSPPLAQNNYAATHGHSIKKTLFRT